MLLAHARAVSRVHSGGLLMFAAFDDRLPLPADHSTGPLYLRAASKLLALLTPLNLLYCSRGLTPINESAHTQASASIARKPPCTTQPLVDQKSALGSRCVRPVVVFARMISELKPQSKWWRVPPSRRGGKCAPGRSGAEPTGDAPRPGSDPGPTGLLRRFVPLSRPPCVSGGGCPGHKHRPIPSAIRGRPGDGRNGRKTMKDKKDKARSAKEVAAQVSENLDQVDKVSDQEIKGKVAEAIKKGNAKNN